MFLCGVAKGLVAKITCASLTGSGDQNLIQD